MIMNKSIIHPKFEGTLVLISGLHGLGKTTLAVTMENPALTGMVDFDLKGRALAESLNMAWYNAPEHVGNPDDYDVKKLGDWFLKTLADIPENITHLIIDNATWAEAGLAQRVMQNPAKYGVNAKNAQAGVYGGVNPGITVLWSNIFTFLQNRGVKVVTVINHMSQPWVNGAPAPNKFNVKGNKVFNQIASLAIILTPGNDQRGGKPPIPSGLVIKEALSLTRFDEELGEFSTVKAIPARIPVCNWKRITGFFDNPADFAKPGTGQEWSKAEVDSYSEWLSPEQIQWVMKVKSYSDEDTPEGEQVTKAPATIEQPKPIPPAEQAIVANQTVDTSTGEVVTPKGKVARPMSPEKVKQATTAKREYTVTKSPSDNQATYAFTSLSKACEGDDDTRHIVIEYLFGLTSMKDMNGGQCSFIIDWCGAKADNEYMVNPDTVKEIRGIVREVVKMAGQTDMFEADPERNSEWWAEQEDGNKEPSWQGVPPEEGMLEMGKEH